MSVGYVVTKARSVHCALQSGGVVGAEHAAARRTEVSYVISSVDAEAIEHVRPVYLRPRHRIELSARLNRIHRRLAAQHGLHSRRRQSAAQVSAGQRGGGRNRYLTT